MVALASAFGASVKGFKAASKNGKVKGESFSHTEWLRLSAEAASGSCWMVRDGKCRGNGKSITTTPFCRGCLSARADDSAGLREAKLDEDEKSSKKPRNK